MRGLVFMAVVGCTSAPRSEEPPRKVAVMAKSSKAKPSAGIRGPDELGVSSWGDPPEFPCDDCAQCRATEVVASSTRPEADGIRFDAKHLLDGNPSSVWCEGEGDEEPSSVTFTIPSGCRIHALEIQGGHLGDRVRLAKHGRVAAIGIAAGRMRGEGELADPIETDLNLKQLIDKPAVLYAGWTAYAVEELRVTFQRTFAGSEYRGVCLSGLVPQLTGSPTED